jgi:hypothetical protein
MSDPFEAKVAAALGNVKEAASEDLETLRRFVDTLERQERPPSWRPVWAGFALVVALATGLVVSRSFGIPTVGSFLIDSGDPRYLECSGDQQKVITAFPLDSATEFPQHFPNAPAIHLPHMTDPGFVVVFADPWSGPILPQVGSAEVKGANVNPPGYRDVCLWIGSPDAGTQYILPHVDMSGFLP